MLHFGDLGWVRLVCRRTEGDGSGEKKPCYTSADSTHIQIDGENQQKGYLDLPDRNIISVGAKCFRSGEASGIVDFFPLPHESDANIRKYLDANVMLSGGETSLLALNVSMERLSFQPGSLACGFHDTSYQNHEVRL